MSRQWSRMIVAVLADDAEFERFVTALARLAKDAGCASIEVYPLVSDAEPVPVDVLTVGSN